MVAIYNLMNKGEKNLTKAELKILTAMFITAENYEETVLGLKPFKEPETIAEIVELKLFENKMSYRRRTPSCVFLLLIFQVQ